MIDADYVERLQTALHDLETRLSDPAVSSDRKLFQKLMTDHARQKHLLEVSERFHNLATQQTGNAELLEDSSLDEELREMALTEQEELTNQLAEAQRTFQIALLPPDEQDNANTIIEIRAGTGGDEAGLFAGDLWRMYSRYAETQGWKCEVMEASHSEAGGVKEVSFSIEGTQVYKRLKYESGVHRVQRVPATEASGRIHTSAATVAVLPEATDVEIDIKTEDLRIDVFRSSGPGGQSVNTTDSAIRITHAPTGLVVTCQDEKSQHRNKDKAMRVLKARLFDLKQQEEQDKMASQRRSQIGSGDRSERIRTYNFPQNRVSDHRINLTLYHLDRIIEGDLDELIDALYNHDVETRLSEELSAHDL